MEDQGVVVVSNQSDVDLNIEKFAENLLQEKELENVDRRTRDIMRDELVDRLEKVTNRVLVDAIPEGKLPEFEVLIDKGANADELRAFVQENVPEIENKLIDAYFDFRRLYLGL